MLHCKLVVSLVLVACFISAGNCQSGDACPSLVGEPSCVCNLPEGKGVIDLRPIAKAQNDRPWFVNCIYRYKKLPPSFHAGFQVCKINMAIPIHTIPAIPTAKGFVVMFMYVLLPKSYVYVLDNCVPQSCQTSNFNPDITYSIASAGTEGIYIDPNGTPYVYYTGPGGR